MVAYFDYDTLFRIFENLHLDRNAHCLSRSHDYYFQTMFGSLSEKANHEEDIID